MVLNVKRTTKMYYNIYDEYIINIVVHVFGYIYVIGLIHAPRMEQVTIINVQQTNGTVHTPTRTRHNKVPKKTKATLWFNKICR